MASKQPIKAPAADVVPSGELLQLATSDIIPSKNNPRHLFDPEPLSALRENIRKHGVLVPITVYQPKGQKRYSILDGERRFRCCQEIEAEDEVDLFIPANIVSTPTKIAGLLYMFSIHNFREQWELMPTALGLQSVIDAIEESDNGKLSKLTGLSIAQIERCRKLLAYPRRFQELSLDPNPTTRIPSNFWIELQPVIELIETAMPKYFGKKGYEGILDALVTKYRAKRVKSVIHFRRIIEAFEVAEGRQADVLARLEQYIENVELETRAAFDEFVVDNRRIENALEACERFIKDIKRFKVIHTVDKRQDLREAFNQIRAFADDMLAKLEGEDAPSDDKDDDE